MLLGVGDGRAVEPHLAGARGSVPAGGRADAPRGGPRNYLARAARPTVAPRRSLAELVSTARCWSPRTLPTLRSDIPAQSPASAARTVLSVAHRARPSGR